MPRTGHSIFLSEQSELRKMSALGPGGGRPPLMNRARLGARPEGPGYKTPIRPAYPGSSGQALPDSHISQVFFAVILAAVRPRESSGLSFLFSKKKTKTPGPSALAGQGRQRYLPHSSEAQEKMCECRRDKPEDDDLLDDQTSIHPALVFASRLCRKRAHCKQARICMDP